MRVYCSGRCHLNKWTDQSQIAHGRIELVADNVLFLERKAEAAQPVAEEVAEEPASE